MFKVSREDRGNRQDNYDNSHKEFDRQNILFTSSSYLPASIERCGYQTQNQKLFGIWYSHTPELQFVDGVGVLLSHLAYNT